MSDEEDSLHLITQRCSVTAFDLKLELSKDGRERGLWFILDDQSNERLEAYLEWLDTATETIFRILEVPAEKKLLISMALQEVRNLLKTEVHEGALIEWEQLEEIYKHIGQQIRHAEKKGLL